MKRRSLDRLARSLGFPPGLWSDGGDGLRAEEERSWVVRLAWWASGEPVGSRLELQPRARSGRLVTPRGSGGTHDVEVYWWRTMGALRGVVGQPTPRANVLDDLDHPDRDDHPQSGAVLAVRRGSRPRPSRGAYR